MKKKFVKLFDKINFLLLHELWSRYNTERKEDK